MTKHMQQLMSNNAHTAWHAQPINVICEILTTSATGLDQEEATKRLKQYGPNRLPKAKQQSYLIRFLLQFHNILIYILLVCALLTAMLHHWIDMSVILAVIIINAFIGLIQEGKAEKAMDAIRHMLAPRSNVIRNGNRINIKGEELVPGDIVLLEAGDKVPADIRLLTAHGLSAQEAILTGESISVEKNIKPVAHDAPLGDRFCLMFSGTLIASGQGKGIVIATGIDTEIGRISGLLSQVEKLTTPLVTQMRIFAQWITIFIVLVATLLLIYGYFVAHHEFSEMFMAVVGLSVAAIPEGLPAVLTITLAIGVQAMAKRNAIVRHLPAIETIGSVSVICTDKTGTLTHNEMMVTSVITPQHLFMLTGNSYEPIGNLTLDSVNVSPAKYKILYEIARAATLCNDASLRQHNNIWRVEGDPMEGALLAFAGKMDLDTHDEQATWNRTDIIAFDAKHRFMATLNHNHEKHALVFVKGAPEQILKMCMNQRSSNDHIEPLNITYWNTAAENIANLGQRVLAFAIKSVPPTHTVLEHNEIAGTITLLGMVGMIDPPRAEAITAIAECHTAGIQVKMITGDHAKTAIAIGKQIGLKNTDRVLTGTEIDNLDEVQLRQVLLAYDIFARTSPEHKLRLVMALQDHKMTVAMTGDGVNDAPALKRADAGIAMGKKGSEASKEAAELVLVDDNFASIVCAIREGRTVYENIQKVISWTLPTNAGQAMTIIVALLFGLTLPITPIQILWVNLVTGVTLGLALAFEPSTATTMRRPPRPRYEPLLNSTLVWNIIFVSLLFLCGVYGVYKYALDRGASLKLARTLAVNMLVIMEIFHLFFIRNIYNTSLTWQNIRGTKIVWITVSIIILAQCAFTYLPWAQVVFITEPMPFWDWILIIIIGTVMFALTEIEKQIRLALTN